MWNAISGWFRSKIYPRHFRVILVNPSTMEAKQIEFDALDKLEMTGRFAGDCHETIVVHPKDWKNLSKSVNLNQEDRVRRSLLNRD